MSFGPRKARIKLLEGNKAQNRNKLTQGTKTNTKDQKINSRIYKYISRGDKVNKPVYNTINKCI